MRWTVDSKIMCTKKSAPGLFPADHPKPIVIETPDGLVKLGVKVTDCFSLGLGYLSITPIAGVSFEPEGETAVIGQQSKGA